MDQALIPINDIITTGWKFYQKNYLKFLKPLGILILPYVFFYSLNFLLQSYTGALINLSMFVFFLFCLFIEFWMMIYMIKLADSLMKNQTLDETKLFSTALNKIPSFIWITILTALITIGGTILFIVPGIFWGIWYSYSLYVNILEEGNYKGMEALKASKKLVKRRAWDTYGRTLLPALFIILPLYLSCGLIFLILFAAGLYSAWVFGIIYIIFLIAVLALVPLFYSFQIIVYNNLKETRNITFPVETVATQPVTPTQPAQM